jgi:hypothetical protein
LDDFLHASAKVAVHAAVTGGEGFADLEEIAHAERDGVDAEAAGNHVDLAFRGPGCLGAAEAAE